MNLKSNLVRSVYPLNLQNQGYITTQHQSYMETDFSYLIRLSLFVVLCTYPRGLQLASLNLVALLQRVTLVNHY